MATKKSKSKRHPVPRKKAARPVTAPGSTALEQVFRKLSKASGALFSDQTTFLITEESAHILLTETFETLAEAAKAGKLQTAASRIFAGAKGERAAVASIANIMQAEWRNLPVFSENSGRKVARDIKDCIFPPVE